MLWAITSYFNPAGYRTRLANFREFRRRLAVPLLAVEFRYGERFEIEDGDADLVVRLSGRDVLWQKERLLNVAVRHLPAECTAVASLDCDVVFERDDWGAAARTLLGRFPIVQLFSRVNHVGRDWGPGSTLWDTVGLVQESCAGAIVRGQDPLTVLSTQRGPGGLTVNGYGWAYRREVLERCGFYDAGIVGGGDTAMVSAAFGLSGVVIERHAMNPAQQEFYREWADQFLRVVAGRVGCLDGNLFHLWHGRLEDRRSRQRYLDLVPFRFDPRCDIAQDDNGGWRWSTDKPGLHAHVREYFATRREDG